MTRMMTVEVLGVDLVVEVEATPEITVIAVLLDGTEIMELLNDWTIQKCREQVAERLAAEPAQIHEPCHEEDR